MAILDDFADLMNIEFTLMEKAITIDPITKEEITSSFNSIGSPHKCLLYTKAMAEKYFGSAWKADVSNVVITQPFTINKDQYISIDSVIYPISSFDDVATQGEVLLIGLRDIT